MSKTITETQTDREGKLHTYVKTIQEQPLNHNTLGPLIFEWLNLEIPEDIVDGRSMIKDIAQRKKLRAFWTEYRQQHQQKLHTGELHL